MREIFVAIHNSDLASLEKLLQLKLTKKDKPIIDYTKKGKLITPLYYAYHQFVYFKLLK